MPLQSFALSLLLLLAISQRSLVGGSHDDRPTYPASAATAWDVVVAGSLWEFAWVVQLLELCPPDLVRPSSAARPAQWTSARPWKPSYYDQAPGWIFVENAEELLEYHSRLQADLELVGGRHESAPTSAVHRRRRTIYVTNLLLDPVVLATLQDTAARHPDTGLIAVDETGVLTEAMCDAFQFVVRIGFAHFFDPSRGFTMELWNEPRNTIVVPLGVPAVSPQWERQGRAAVEGLREGADASGDGDGNPRDLVWAYTGRIQNGNRVSMVKEMNGLGLEETQRFFHPTGNATSTGWIAGQLTGVDQLKYTDTLARTILAPSPVGNSHPECYRTYEALAAGALPLVDTDYYKVVFGAPLVEVGVDWEHTKDLRPLLADESGLQRLETLRVQAVSWWRAAQKEYPRRVLELMLRTGRELELTYASAASPYAVAVRSAAAAAAVAAAAGQLPERMLLPNLVEAMGLSGEAVLVGASAGPGLALARALYESSSLSRIHLVARWTSRLTDEGANGPHEHIDGSATFDRWQCAALQDISQATEHVESWTETIAHPLLRVRFVLGTSRDDTIRSYDSCPASASAGLGATSLWPRESLDLVYFGSGVGGELEVALRAWWPKLREGGLMGGVGWPEIRGIVEAFLSTTATPTDAVREEGGSGTGGVGGGSWYVAKEM